MSIVALINGVLTLLNYFVQWGQSRKLFKEAEALIVSAILSNALRDINLVKESNARLDAEFKLDPSNIVRDDQFTRPE